MKDKHIPFYLEKKLSLFGINTKEDLLKYNFIEVYKWIKDIYPSSSFKILFDLFCITNNIQFNSLTSKLKNEIKNTYKLFPPSYAPLEYSTMVGYLNQAKNILEMGDNLNEIPVGAIVVCNEKIIATAKNMCINDNITNHAEIIAINKASLFLKTSRLINCDLYVTIEPCLMCSGAIINSRIKRLIFGAPQPKTGAVLSQYKVLENLNVNKHTQVIGPISQSYAQQMQLYFLNKR